MSELCSVSIDIPEIITTKVNAAVGENVSEYAIRLATAATLAHRYGGGREKITLNVKTADSDAEILIDVACVASTACDLFIQSHLKLNGLLGRSTAMNDMTIELSGELMRPVMRYINKSADSEATIRLQCKRAEDKTVCRFIFSREHYSDELIQQMARHFKNILSDITEHPEVQIKNIAMLDAEERAEIVKRGTGPKIEIERKCAHHFFEKQAAKKPDATALICGKHRMSYKELNDRANIIGHFLQGLGVVPEFVVGIGIERSIEAVICILAVLKAGGAYTIVDPEYPAARIKEILSDAQIRLLITQSSMKTRFEYEGLRVIDYDQFVDSPKENTENVVSDVTVDNTANIAFTSGTTGKPKGIIVPHLSNSTLLDLGQFMYKENATDEVGCLLSPLSFGASIGAIFLPLCYGIPLVIIPNGEEKDPYKFACHISDHKITSFVATPALVRLLCSLNEESRKMLQSVIHDPRLNNA